MFLTLPVLEYLCRIVPQCLCRTPCFIGTKSMGHFVMIQHVKVLSIWIVKMMSSLIVFQKL